MLASPFVRKVVIENEIGERLLVPMNWGLLRAYPGGTGIFPTSAHADAILENPLFRNLLLTGRCLVPMRGYFERIDCPKASEKEAYFISVATKEIFAVAGIYAASMTANGVIAASYCMITTEATPDLGFLGDRMPAILRTEDEEASWLSQSKTDPAKLLSMLRPYDGELNVSVIPSLEEAAWTLRRPGESRRQYKTSRLPGDFG